MKRLTITFFCLLYSLTVYGSIGNFKFESVQYNYNICQLENYNCVEKLPQIDLVDFKMDLLSLTYSQIKDKIVRKYIENSTKEQAKIYWADYIDKNIKPFYSVNYLGASKFMQENMKFTTENIIYIKYSMENENAISTIIITYSFFAKEFSIALDKINYYDKKTKKNILVSKNSTSAELQNYYDSVKNEFLLKHAEYISTENNRK